MNEIVGTRAIVNDMVMLKARTIARKRAINWITRKIPEARSIKTVSCLWEHGLWKVKTKFVEVITEEEDENIYSDYIYRRHEKLFQIAVKDGIATIVGIGETRALSSWIEGWDNY